MPKPPPLPPSQSKQDVVKVWILAVCAILGILAALLALAVLTPNPSGSKLGACTCANVAISEGDSEGAADSGGAAENAGGNAIKSSVGTAEVANPESEEPASGPKAGDIDANDSGSNCEGEAMAASESLGTADLQNEGDRVSRATTRNFFTLDSNQGRPTTKATDERSSGERANIQDLLAGRSAEAKGELLRGGGGTSATEGAVKLGLEWLARNQQSNGLWSLRGPYDDGGMRENFAAATAMALLAFQGAGHTHKGDPADPYTAVVARGSAALLEHIRVEGKSYRSSGLHGGYTQALCTIALCELFGMTRDPKLRKPVQDAVDYCIDAQSAEGGWRYEPRQDSDTSVTGWFVLALQSARMAGVKVPNETFGRVTEYLNSAASNGGSRYGYQQGTVATRSMTAEALLCRQYLGWKQNDPRLIRGTDYLIDEVPNWESPDVYYWYYATQVFHHVGGARWERWNDVMREVLPAEQVTVGRDRGSWKPRGDIHAHAGGRLYVTCMCLYMLEVYYRHLPIYQGSGDGASK